MSRTSFSPKARWDRNVPLVKDANSWDEKIEVWAHFKNARIIPSAFLWNNKEYRIKKITYNWQERKGQEIISFFSVDTGANLYQLSFNNTTFSWRIDKIIA